MSSSSEQQAPVPLIPQPGVTIKRDIAAEAYADALRYLELEFQGNSKALVWLNTISSTSLSDVVTITQEAEDKYAEAKQNKKSSREWLRGLSKRIMYYGNVLDVLSQHHPEYVALVWGLVKFVLTGVINHRNLVAQFSQALSMIAQVLPRTKVSAELYQTNEMKDAVASLYAHILLFLQKAARWYNYSSAGRALSALFRPFELSYKESLDQIILCSQQIDDISSIASKVEIREIKVLVEGESTKLVKQEKKLHEMQVQFNAAHEELSSKVGSILQIISCKKSPSSKEIPTRTRLTIHKGSATRLNEIYVDVKEMKPRIGDMHFSHVLSALEPKNSPESSLQVHRSLIRRSSPWRSQNKNTLELIQSVGQWISSPRSPLLILQTQPRAQARVKEIATELIGMLQPHSKSVVWHLSSVSSKQNDGISSIDILKSLIFQCMKLVPELITSDPGKFSAVTMHANHSEVEWLELLCYILRHMNTCFVVIEASDVLGDKIESEQLFGLVQRLAAQFQDGGNSIKLVIVNYSSSWNASSPIGRLGRVLSVNREPPVPPARRRPGVRSPFRRMGGIAKTGFER
ncbi:hypothetical protein FSPOR_2865 [Fusarium sporotrichioides]|uniref:DUF7708 domain-containing protein n=1 Tax=Fusarium sporotrichioides TaxID=5514 RepID=A0A395SID3_FUSSP|nr:hypothetical protein FSPOR_2865 [Fusarium sporotrichioides]